MRPRLWLHGAYTRGADNFDNFPADRIGDFRAHTGTAYDFQNRANGVTMGRLYVSFVQSF